MKKNVFESQRLIFRELTPSDARNFYLLNLDPEVIQFTGDFPFESEEEARSFLENYNQYQKYGYGRWATLLKSNDEWLGWCGLKYNEGSGEPDLGYRFFKKYWGKGYGTEAAEACLNYGFEKLKLNRIIGRAMKANKASIRIFEKIEMNYVRDIKLDGKPAVEYEARCG